MYPAHRYTYPLHHASEHASCMQRALCSLWPGSETKVVMKHVKIRPATNMSSALLVRVRLGQLESVRTLLAKYDILEIVCHERRGVAVLEALIRKSNRNFSLHRLVD